MSKKLLILALSLGFAGCASYSVSKQLEEILSVPVVLDTDAERIINSSRYSSGCVARQASIIRSYFEDLAQNPGALSELNTKIVNRGVSKIYISTSYPADYASWVVRKVEVWRGKEDSTNIGTIKMTKEVSEEAADNQMIPAASDLISEIPAPPVHRLEVNENNVLEVELLANTSYVKYFSVYVDVTTVEGLQLSQSLNTVEDVRSFLNSGYSDQVTIEMQGGGAYSGSYGHICPPLQEKTDIASAIDRALR